MFDHLHNSYWSRASAITHGYGSTQSTNFGRRQSLMSSVTIGTDRPRSKLVTRKSEIILTGKKQSIIVAKKVSTCFIMYESYRLSHNGGMILKLWDGSWLWDGNKVIFLGACWRGRRKERLVGNITFNINSYSYWCLSWSLSGHLNPRYNY